MFFVETPNEKRGTIVHTASLSQGEWPRPALSSPWLLPWVCPAVAPVVPGMRPAVGPSGVKQAPVPQQSHGGSPVALLALSHCTCPPHRHARPDLLVVRGVGVLAFADKASAWSIFPASPPLRAKADSQHVPKALFLHTLSSAGPLLPTFLLPHSPSIYAITAHLAPAVCKAPWLFR